MKTWELSNFVGETITFEENEVENNMTFNFFNCEKCTVVIKGKFKAAMMNRCKKVDFSLTECISVIEIIRCDDMKLRTAVKVPMINVEHTNGCQIYSSMVSKKTVKVANTCSQSVSMIFPKDEGTYDPNNEEDDDTHCCVIPETWLTKIENEKIVVTAQDLAD
jgi:adenylyl cyclase-associated protein